MANHRKKHVMLARKFLSTDPDMSVNVLVERFAEKGIRIDRGAASKYMADLRTLKARQAMFGASAAMRMFNGRGTRSR